METDGDAVTVRVALLSFDSTLCQPFTRAKGGYGVELSGGHSGHLRQITDRERIGSQASPSPLVAGRYGYGLSSQRADCGTSYPKRGQVEVGDRHVQGVHPQ